MGNTSSSPTSRSFNISGPRSLNRKLTSPKSPKAKAHRLGPEYIISPYPYSNAGSRTDLTSNHHLPIPNGHRNASQVSLQSTSRSVHTSKSQTFSASRTDVSSPSASDFRRARSANVTGPTRAERTSEFLGAPPPYSHEDASRSNLELDTRTQFLSVPGPQLGREKGHKRSSSDSAVTPSPSASSGSTPWARVAHQRSTSNLTEEDWEYFYGNDYGYGVGNGRASMAMPQPQLPPSRSTGATSMSTSDYSDSEPGTELVTSPTTASSTYSEDPLELLKRYKTVFVIDDSASMTGERWEEAREALCSLADIAAKYETDGFDVYFINSRRSAQQLRSSYSVKRVFDTVTPHGISLLATKLEEMLNEYISELEMAQKEVLRGDLHALQRTPPMNYIVLTDGMPTDDPEAVIVQAARRLDRNNIPISQVGIQFVQVGDDVRAAEALRELDDDLAKEYGIRDMVDFTPYGGALNSEVLIKILLGGINRRVDRKGAKSVLP